MLLSRILRRVVIMLRQEVETLAGSIQSRTGKREQYHILTGIYLHLQNWQRTRCARMLRCAWYQKKIRASLSLEKINKPSSSFQYVRNTFATMNLVNLKPSWDLTNQLLSGTQVRKDQNFPFLIWEIPKL